MKRHLVLLFLLPTALLLAQGMERTDGTKASITAMVLAGVMEHTDGTATSITTDWDATTTASLLLHMDGTDASTTFTDSGATGHTVTANGDAQIDTAQSVFGGASGLFDGTGDYLTVPDHADWFFGTGDFTLDLRARFNALPSAGNAAILVDNGSDSNNRWTLFEWNNSGSHEFIFRVVVAAVYKVSIIAPYPVTTNTWYHVAVTRNGNYWQLYLDGKIIGAVYDTDTVPDYTGTLDIGYTTTVACCTFNGWIDELRIIKGTAAFNPTFTVPTAAY